LFLLTVSKQWENFRFQVFYLLFYLGGNPSRSTKQYGLHLKAARESVGLRKRERDESDIELSSAGASDGNDR
jgi:hypothetical protein